jgi:hypothetical protein
LLRAVQVVVLHSTGSDSGSGAQIDMSDVPERPRLKLKPRDPVAAAQLELQRSSSLSKVGEVST